MKYDLKALLIKRKSKKLSNNSNYNIFHSKLYKENSYLKQIDPAINYKKEVSKVIKLLYDNQNTGIDINKEYEFIITDLEQKLHDEQKEIEMCKERIKDVEAHIKSYKEKINNRTPVVYFEPKPSPNTVRITKDIFLLNEYVSSVKNYVCNVKLEINKIKEITSQLNISQIIATIFSKYKQSLGLLLNEYKDNYTKSSTLRRRLNKYGNTESIHLFEENYGDLEFMLDDYNYEQSENINYKHIYILKEFERNMKIRLEEEIEFDLGSVECKVNSKVNKIISKINSLSEKVKKIQNKLWENDPQRIYGQNILSDFLRILYIKSNIKSNFIVISNAVRIYSEKYLKQIKEREALSKIEFYDGKNLLEIIQAIKDSVN